MSHTSPTPTPQTAALGAPVNTSRQWTTALAPRNGGGWNFITQSYQFGSGLESEWCIVNLEAGTAEIVDGAVDVYSNTNFQIASANTAVVSTNQLRAPNGRIFFPERFGHIGVDIDDQHYVNVAYYDPTDELVHQLPSIQSPGGASLHGIPFSAVFNNAGTALYMGTQAVIGHNPILFRIDPVTLAVTVIGSVGAAASSNPKYAYYLARDEGPGAKWLYVAIGQDPWELVKVDLDTNTATVMLTTSGPGTQFIEFEQRTNGWSVNVTDNGVATRYWLADGATSAYPGSGAPPGGARTITPYPGTLTSPPTIDWSRGIGQVLWQPNGGGAWTLVEWDVERTAPATIESLVVLGSFDCLGNANQYSGFFTASLSGTTEWFGAWPGGLSQPAHCLVGSLVYIAGYPNGVFYVYDPEEAWAPDGTANGNPSLIGNFTASDMKHAYFLVRSSNGNLYCCGQRERDSVGSAIQKYDLEAETFGDAINADLTDYDPRGFIVLDDVDLVVYSGEVLPTSLLTAAQLRVYNRALALQRVTTFLAGVKNTGLLFRTSSPGVVVGLTNDSPYYLYTYDALTGTVLSSQSLGTAVLAAAQDEGGGLIYAAIGGNLKTIDPDTLAIVTILALPNITGIAVRSDIAYVAVDTVVYRVAKGVVLTGHRNTATDVVAPPLTGHLDPTP